MITKRERRLKIKRRVRRNILGTAERPRLTVFRSNKQIYAQLVNDIDGKTIVAASSLGMEDKLPKTEIAAKVGTAVAQAAMSKGVAEVVFDRNGYLYHGRVKQLADAAREAGLKF